MESVQSDPNNQSMRTCYSALSNWVLNILKDGVYNFCEWHVLVFIHSQSKRIFFLILNRMSCISICVHSPLSFYWVKLRRLSLLSVTLISKMHLNILFWKVTLKIWMLFLNDWSLISWVPLYPLPCRKSKVPGVLHEITWEKYLYALIAQETMFF